MSKQANTFLLRHRPLGMAVISGLATAFLLPAAPLLAQDSAIKIDEIVVTARKREERLQDVPISVTVLSAEQIENLQLNSGTDIVAQTPNLQVSLAGNEDQPRFSMRGLAQFDFNLNASSPTGVFYDEVFIASQYLGGPQMFDMQRVEVLRGPQGTLFGKNTTAGAINFLTRNADVTGNGSQYLSGEYGSNNYVRLQGAGDLVLIDDTLAARIAFNTTSSDGWVDNAFPDPESRNLSSIDNQALRIGLNYDKDKLSANLKLFNIRSSPTAIGIIAEGLCPSLRADASNRCDIFAPGLQGNNVNIAGVNPRVSPVDGSPLDIHEGAYDRSGSINVKGNGGYLTVNYDFDKYVLTSITSYLTGSFKNLVDGDGSSANLFHLDFFAHQQEASQDLRITSILNGPLNYIAGIYYFRDEITPVTGSQFGGPVFFLTGTTAYTQTRKSLAAYIDGTYQLNDAWELYAGLRYTRDKGDVSNYLVTSFPGVTSQLLGVEYDEGEPTGRIGLRHSISNNVMAYVQFARGYRSSAINGGADTQEELNVAKPEILDSYEAGIKSTLLDGRLILNGSAFFYNFTDQQFRNNSVALSNPLSTVLINAAEAEITGLEIEAIANITDNLRLVAGMGLVDSEYKELVLRDPDGVDRDLAGNELLEAAPYSFNLALDYRHHLGNGGSVDYMINASGQGKRYFTAFNELPPNDVNMSPANWESNARITYTTADERIQVGIWGKNLNDNTEVNWSVAPAVFGIRFTTIPYPRRFGVDFRMNF